MYTCMYIYTGGLFDDVASTFSDDFVHLGHDEVGVCMGFICVCGWVGGWVYAYDLYTYI